MQSLFKMLVQYLGVPLVKELVKALRDALLNFIAKRRKKKIEKLSNEIADALNKKNPNKDDVRDLNDKLRKL